MTRLHRVGLEKSNPIYENPIQGSAQNLLAVLFSKFSFCGCRQYGVITASCLLPPKNPMWPRPVVREGIQPDNPATGSSG
jgi:hypothetical protein